jgi:hypothetical protein
VRAGSAAAHGEANDGSAVFVCRMQHEPLANQFLPLHPAGAAPALCSCTARDGYERLLQLEAAVDWQRIDPAWIGRRLQWAHNALLAGTAPQLCRVTLDLGAALRPAATERWARALESGAWEAVLRGAQSIRVLAEAAAQLCECVREDALRPGALLPRALPLAGMDDCH